MATSSIVDAERFVMRYSMSGEAAMLATEREALGSDYQANGYTDVAEAIDLGERLQLGAGQLLLDVGTGCGWPGLFLAATHRCAVVGLDPVTGGAATARKRAVADGMADRAWSMLGSADALPIKAGAIDAVVHTDLMC